MILVTGGTGYIGSHTAAVLRAQGRPVAILDNLCNSEESVIARLEKLGGGPLPFIKGDVRDRALLRKIFAEHKITAVMHFAGLKAVGESVRAPLDYYDVNLGGAMALLQAMRAAGVFTFVFSSSATVYGDPEEAAMIAEDCAYAPTNPYGRSKMMVEMFLADLHRAAPDFRIARLRYFNPAGAHESGLIGETPQGIPNNLMPYMAQVAAGQRECLHIFGKDYPTRDGTGIRDYIHVMDLAEGHRAALDYLEKNGGFLTINLGTGRGTSVLELVRAFARASGRGVPHEFTPPRPGDVAMYVADPSRAQKLLGWRARRGIDAMCADAWRWQSGVGKG